MTSTTETTGNAPVATRKERKEADAGARRAHVASAKGKLGKKASSGKKGEAVKESATSTKGSRKPKSTPAAARSGSKTSNVLDLLKRAGGVTGMELMKATGWQPHSVRGFLSGTIGKKMGLAVTSTKCENGGRTYSVKG